MHTVTHTFGITQHPFLYYPNIIVCVCVCDSEEKQMSANRQSPVHTTQ